MISGDQQDSDLEDHHLVRLGTRNPRCTIEGCGETDPRALTGTDPNIVCYEHRQLADAKTWVEQDHRPGQHNHPATTAIPANDHRILSAMQKSWPRDTLRNPDGSPLLKAAACVRGWLDLLRLILERTVGWVPPFLEMLDAWLRERIGDPWWKDFPSAGSDVA
jgi:hypothetical protein